MHRFISVTNRCILLVLVWTMLAVAAPRPAYASYGLDTEEAKFLRLVNEYRVTKGLPTLKLSPKLTRASDWLSRDMGAKNYFSHTDSLGRSPFTRMAAFSYTYSTAKAENIAAGNSTAEDAFTQWINSDGHRKNIENSSYRAIGIGRVYTSGSRYSWYWTTKFGGTADTTTSAALSNHSGTSGGYYQYPSNAQVKVSGTVVGNYSGTRMSVYVQKYVYDSAQGKYVWKAHATYHPTLSSSSRYATSFTPSGGKYRLQTVFSGGGYVVTSRTTWRYFQVAATL